MSSMENMDIRIAAKSAGIPLWKVAESLHVSESYFYRRIRKPLPEDEKVKILSLIQDLSAT